jgi:hypothetical protein
MNGKTFALAGLLAIAASSAACNGNDGSPDAAADAGASNDAPNNVAPPSDAAATDAGETASDASPSVVSTAVF